MSERSMIHRSASERADELRESLKGVRDVDAQLAEASRLKREAAAESERLVAEAQAVVDELLREAKGRAVTILGEARTAADEAQHRLDARLGGIETGVRDLAAHLEGALRSVNALALTLEGVRTGNGPAPDAAGEPTRELVDTTTVVSDDLGARPLGWLFRATAQG